MSHYAIILEYPDNVNAEAINCVEEDFNNSYQDFAVTSEDILNYYLNNSWNSCYQTTNNYLIKSIIKKVYYEVTNNFRER